MIQDETWEIGDEAWKVFKGKGIGEHRQLVCEALSTGQAREIVALPDLVRACLLALDAADSGHPLDGTETDYLRGALRKAGVLK